MTATEVRQSLMDKLNESPIGTKFYFEYLCDVFELDKNDRIFYYNKMLEKINLGEFCVTKEALIEYVSLLKTNLENELENNTEEG